MYVWWPGIDTDVEKMVKCESCQAVQSMPPLAPLHPWRWPTRPWSRDYAGPFLGRMFLVLIDAHSKWIEAYATSSATSSVVTQW